MRISFWIGEKAKRRIISARPGGSRRLPRVVAVFVMCGLIGVLAGGAAEINILPIVMRAIEVRGILVGSRAMFEAMNRAIRAHELRPVIDRVFPFQETPAAFRHLESAAHFGKIVIRL